MNLYMIEDGRKVEAGEYIQVGHRLVHRDEIIFSDIFKAAENKGRSARHEAPVKAGSRYEISSQIIANRYLRVEVYGEFDFQNGAQIIGEIRGICESSGEHGLLLDFHGTRLQTNTVEQYYLVHDLVSSGYQTIGKMAVVTAAPKTDFFEKAARNRMIDLKFFSDTDTAVAWLTI